MLITLNAKDRKKELVKALEEINNCKAKYLGVPSCAYRIGEATVTKEGNVETEDENLMADLKEYGFTAENEVEELGEQAEGIEEIEEIAEALDALSGIDSIPDADSLTLSFPDTGFNEAAFERLKAIVDAKAGLITKAFDTISTNVIWDKEEHTIQFPWFKLETAENEDEKLAYILFLNKLLTFAKEAKRVTAKEKDTDNEKYAFRCFLLRLGFIGDEYKGARKLLLARLAGNSAFRSGFAKEVK